VNAGMGVQGNPPVSGAGGHAHILNSGWEAGWNASLATTTASLVSALKCDAPLQSWTDTAGDSESRPISCVTWYEAMAFCVWDGGYLPTEAEWNYAAAGGDQQRAYPWSVPAAALTLDGNHASFFDGESCVGDGLPGCSLTDLVEVGTKPAGNGRWGHSDLAGNVTEWTLDWAAPYISDCTDCADLALATRREIRGGGFNSSPSSLRTATRSGLSPGSRISTLGFRCARRG
jgi:formylglycine-generating enzyme required for sulfatase activity